MQDGYGDLVMYGEESPSMSFLCYHGGAPRNGDMCGEVGIGVVIHGRIRMLFYVLLIHLSLPLV